MLVVTDPDAVFLEAFDEVLYQSGFTDAGKTRETDERSFESFPVPVHSNNALSL